MRLVERGRLNSQWNIVQRSCVCRIEIRPKNYVELRDIDVLAFGFDRIGDTRLSDHLKDDRENGIDRIGPGKGRSKIKCHSYLFANLMFKNSLSNLFSFDRDIGANASVIGRAQNCDERGVNLWLRFDRNLKMRECFNGQAEVASTDGKMGFDQSL